ncbi:MAG: HEAT repeat domain-containing protein [Planctomycetota bacterium]
MRTAVLMIVFGLVAGSLAVGGVDAKKTEYQERAAKLATDDANGHYVLGLWCSKNDLDTEARLEFEKVVALDADHEGARSALGYVRHQGRWLSKDEAMRQKGFVRHEGVWLLKEEVAAKLLPATERKRKAEAQAKVRKLLKQMVAGGAKVERIATKALAGVKDNYKVEPLAYALRYPAENVRVFAAKELGRIQDRRALQPLIHRSVIDPSETVREVALDAALAYQDPNLLAPYVKALNSKHQPVRINAAEAVGGLGDVRGIQYLVYRMSAHGGGLNRSHIYLANQLSFIQDFDVEVAQTAFIADPQPGILQEGTTLDVRVLATERQADIVERRVLRNSLKRLSGVDMGDDAEKWGKWWMQNRERLMTKASTE